MDVLLHINFLGEPAKVRRFKASAATNTETCSVKDDDGDWNISFHVERLLMNGRVCCSRRLTMVGWMPSEAFPVSGLEASEPRGEPLGDRALGASGTNRFVFFGLI